jgi:hypothetical protein
MGKTWTNHYIIMSLKFMIYDIMIIWTDALFVRDGEIFIFFLEKYSLLKR